MQEIVTWFQTNTLPLLLVFGVVITLAVISSRYLDQLKLPSIVTYMLIGLLFGPSVLNVLNEGLLNDLHFLTEATLGFVAFKIGLELDLQSLRQKGGGMVFTILFESFLAVAVVTFFLFLLTGSWPLAVLFGALAPASAPAGTVAVIEQYRAKGELTKALYAVVGFDDALGVIIFGVCLAICKGLIVVGGGNEQILHTLIEPFKEIGGSLLLGGALSFMFVHMAKLIEDKLALTFGFILLAVGLSEMMHLSEILSCMVLGMVIGNNKSKHLKDVEEEEVGVVLPLFFILFFTIAGANLHLQSLQHLGTMGILYIVGRTGGLIGGSYLGASIGGLHRKVRNYLGLGILSQAGVAIGLALVLKQQLSGLGPIVDEAEQITKGEQIGQTIFTTITVTTFFFELVGPLLAKTALEKAGEIPYPHQRE